MLNWLTEKGKEILTRGVARLLPKIEEEQDAPPRDCLYSGYYLGGEATVLLCGTDTRSDYLK